MKPEAFKIITETDLEVETIKVDNSSNTRDFMVQTFETKDTKFEHVKEITISINEDEQTISFGLFTLSELATEQLMKFLLFKTK